MFWIEYVRRRGYDEPRLIRRVPANTTQPHEARRMAASRLAQGGVRNSESAPDAYRITNERGDLIYQSW